MPYIPTDNGIEAGELPQDQLIENIFQKGKDYFK
jgi:hypothetical protein